MGWQQIRQNMAAQDPNYASAWGTFDPNNPQNLSPQLLQYIRGGGYNFSPDKKYQLSANYSTDGLGTIEGYGLYDTVNAAPGVPFWTYDQAGKFTGTKAGSDADDPMMALIPAAAALGMGMFLPGAAGGAAAGGTGGAVTGLAEGSALDAMYGGTAMGGGASVAGGAALPAAGATTAMGAGGAAGAAGGVPNLGSLLKGAASGFSWDSLIGPATSLVGGYLNSSASKSAADTLAQAGREAAARFEPWEKAGGWAITEGANLLGKNGPDAAKNAFMASPDYAFRKSEQDNALTKAAAARGLLGSGRFLKDAVRYSGDLASQEYDKRFNRLMATAGMGQTATNSSTGYTTDAASALAAGKTGSANAWGNALTQGVGYYQTNNLLNRLGMR